MRQSFQLLLLNVSSDSPLLCNSFHYVFAFCTPADTLWKITVRAGADSVRVIYALLVITLHY
jgi:hypothetical protein